MHVNQDLQGRVSVVTGGLGQLGRAVARAFEDAGALVAVLDHSTHQASEHPLSDANRLVLGGVDLVQPSQAQTAMAAVSAHFGRIDILVNIAGGFHWQTLADGDLAVWDQMYAVNLKTAVVASRAVLAHLPVAGGGRIINIGAGAAAKAAAGMGAYAAAKSGVQRLTESLAQELKDGGVTVNAILPGTIDTPQNRKDMPDADRTRWVAPQDIASVIVFLASDAARAITGAAIPVFGRG
jgi:NAD(P)-dependent dehydrogenase (short-subunit alcohol dehydrogenase family)